MIEYHPDLLSYYIGAVIMTAIVQVAFCWTLYSVVERVPEEKRALPSWFAWLILIPVVGFVLCWVMIPFTIPKTLATVVENNPEGMAKIRFLKKAGFLNVLCATLVFIPFLGLLLAVAAFVLWIMYWVKLVEFRDTYLP